MKRNRIAADLRPITCLVCGSVAHVRRSDARTCGATCKKRLQRSQRRAEGQGSTARALAPDESRFRLSPLLAAGDKGDRLQALYPQGAKVLFYSADREPMRPGKIDWHSRAGEECCKAGDLVPVADLRGVHKVPALSVFRC